MAVFGVFYETEDGERALSSIHTAQALAKHQVDELAGERDDEGYSPYTICYVMVLNLDTNDTYGPVVYSVRPVNPDIDNDVDSIDEGDGDNEGDGGGPAAADESDESDGGG